MPGNCPYRFQNSVLSWFPGRDETGNTVSSRLVLRFWINWKSRLVSNLDFRRLKSLVLSWKAFCCLDLSWIYLSCLDVLACLVLKKFQDFVPVSTYPRHCNRHNQSELPHFNWHQHNLFNFLQIGYLYKSVGSKVRDSFARNTNISSDIKCITSFKVLKRIWNLRFW